MEVSFDLTRIKPPQSQRVLTRSGNGTKRTLFGAYDILSIEILMNLSNPLCREPASWAFCWRSVFVYLFACCLHLTFSYYDVDRGIYSCIYMTRLSSGNLTVCSPAHLCPR